MGWLWGGRYGVMAVDWWLWGGGYRTVDMGWWLWGGGYGVSVMAVSYGVAVMAVSYGVSVMAVSYGVSVMGCRLWGVSYGVAVMAVSYGVSVMGCQLWAVSYGVSLMGCQLRAAPRPPAHLCPPSRRQRPALGECLARLAAAMPVAFLEPRLNAFNPCSVYSTKSPRERAGGCPPPIKHHSPP